MLTVISFTSANEESSYVDILSIPEHEVIDILGVEDDPGAGARSQEFPRLSIENLISSDLTPEKRHEIEEYLSYPDWAYTRGLIQLGTQLKNSVRPGLLREILDIKISRFRANDPSVQAMVNKRRKKTTQRTRKYHQRQKGLARK